jgi:hypothetical protein
MSLSLILDEISGPFNLEKQENKPTLLLITEVLLYICMLGVIVFFVKKLVNKIKLPIYTSNDELTDLAGGVVFYFVLMFFQSNFSYKLVYLRYRLTNNKSLIDQLKSQKDVISQHI